MGSIKWLFILVLAALVVVGVTLFALNQEPAPVTEEQPDTSQEPIDVQQFQQDVLVDLRVHAGGYSPTEIHAVQGDRVIITARSTDGLEHGFSLPSLGIQREIVPGESIEIRFLASAPGSFEFYSHVASNPNAGNIRGKLIVEPFVE